MKTKPTAEDHLLLMFCMKPEGKFVDFNHCFEKVSRDYGRIGKAKMQAMLKSLVERNLVRARKNKTVLYARTQKALSYFKQRLRKIDEGALNFTYLLVYKARDYYPNVADTILKFCKDRHVGFYVVFTGKRFFRRNFKGRPIQLSSLKDLMFYVDMHYIDIIPCVHRIGKDRPDWLVVDLDAGDLVSFAAVKKVADATYRVMAKLKLKPVIKFSGSKGFQLWAKPSIAELPRWYEPLSLPGGTQRERNFFTLYCDMIRAIQWLVDKKIPEATIGIPLRREQRRDKVLLDFASMKQAGLVRVPFGIHSKTGLVSVPIAAGEIKKFKKEHAEPGCVIKQYKRRKRLFALKEASPEKLFDALREYRENAKD